MSSQDLDVAIIGWAGRFPGAADIASLWQNLCAGTESIRQLSVSELAAAGIAPELHERPDYVRAQGTLADIEQFDRAFFGYTAHEAAMLDPQHRVFLQCAWEAFEAAGLDPEQLRERVGVYAGSSFNGYLFHLFPHGARVQSADELSALLALDKDFLATRVSYKLDLRGPSVAVQTACSTSLVAVHLACQALLLGECELALAGGVSINVPQQVGYLYQEGAIASPDGHCRAFDAEARGTVSGSGAGVVLLKRLDDALSAGDPVLALIKGSAINNDGRDKVGFTAPSALGQARVIQAAQQAADVDAASIGYVEAHGTATPLGDPIEVAALTQAFRASTAARGYCALGSLKTNLGHLDAAAGIAGLIKAALVLRYGVIPKSLHYRAPNPNIDLASSPFYVADETRPWPAQLAPRRAGVSSFGIGGTNAHVVLEQAPPRAALPVTDGAQLLCLSARSERGLRALRERLAVALERDPTLRLADVAHTLRVGRRAFDVRASLIAADTAGAIAALRGSTPSARRAGRSTRPVAFLFPGQGSQQLAAGRALYHTAQTFREPLDRCAELLGQSIDIDVRALLFAPNAASADAKAKLSETAITQPVTFVLSYALACHLEALGIVPAALIGHSVGEYVAACLGGTLTLPDALSLVTQRGRLMQATAPGAMLAVAASAAELARELGRGVELAALNGPRQCVLAGPHAAIAHVERELTARGVQTRRLQVSHAFHSASMEPALPAFREVLERTSLRAPRRRWMSNVTGDWITAAQAQDPAYWLSHMRQPVRFAAGMSKLLGELDPLCLELGSGSALSTLCLQIQPESTACALLGDPHISALGLAGELWTHGLPLQLPAGAGEGQRIELPATPFELSRHWIEAPTAAAAPSHAPVERPVSTWLHAPSWRRAEPLGAAPAAPAGERYLLLSDDLGLVQAFERALGQERVLHARSAATSARLDQRSFAVAAAEPEALGALVEALGDGALRVVLAFPLATEPVDSQTFWPTQVRGVECLLGLARALSLRTAPTQLLVLTRGLLDVTGSETLRPGHAALLGAARSVHSELPQLRCRVIDVDAVALDGGSADLLSSVEAERGEGDVVVAHRARHRWLPTVEPLREPARELALRAGGVYVITGGLGDVGLLLAEALLARAPVRLVLVSRSAPDVSQAARLDALRASGGELHVARADVTDRAAMHDVLRDARARLGGLHGVIHAAGVAHGGLVASMDGQRLRDELSAKAYGALLLSELCAGQQLDFLVLLSSLTGLSGGLGQAGYAAANTFLDALASTLQRRGEPVVSVALDRFRDLGMARRASARLRQLGLAEQTLSGMSRAQGAEVLRLALAVRHLPQLVVSRAALYGMPHDDLPLRPATASRAGAAASRLPSAASLAELTDAMAAVWEQAFGLAPLDRQADFYALGGESLLALQILQRVRETFGVELPLAEFFAARTIDGLAGAVHRARATVSAGDEAEPALVSLPRRARKLTGAQGGE
jgi:phthiocerol/phenolphthiocerol synthesis type-I polyketide synthase E